MAGFDAAAVVDPLEYNFSKLAYEDPRTGTGEVVIPALVGVKGVIPEPNDARMARYMDDLKALVEDARARLPHDIDAGDPEAVLGAINDLETENYVDLQEKMADIYSRFTNGKITAEQIMAVPPRIRTVFYTWLRKETADPEVKTAAGKTPDNVRRLAAGG